VQGVECGEQGGGWREQGGGWRVRTNVAGSAALHNEGEVVGLGRAQLPPRGELHARRLPLDEELHHLSRAVLLTGQLN